MVNGISGFSEPLSHLAPSHESEPHSPAHKKNNNRTLRERLFLLGTRAGLRGAAATPERFVSVCIIMAQVCNPLFLFLRVFSTRFRLHIS
jgi:hypothetical protein